ncbi:MAG: hypothetical protein DMG96_00145, partial [Acidobacteria bacterium]
PLTEDSALRTKLHVYPPGLLKRLQTVFSWVDDDYDKIPVERAVLSDSSLPGTVLRLSMVYGPGDPLHRFFPVIKRVLDGRTRILFSQDMAAWRAPRGYVENVAAAIALAAVSERAAGRIYNVAEWPAFSELGWAQKIAAQMDWHGEFAVLPADRTPKHLLPGMRRNIGLRARSEYVTSSDIMSLCLSTKRSVAPSLGSVRIHQLRSTLTSLITLPKMRLSFSHCAITPIDRQHF